MPSIIEQIQRDALDRNVPVSDLLRRVKLAASKLGLGVVEDWVENELNGYYTDGRDVPDYRIVRGHPKARNPVLGWVPIVGSTEGLLSTRPVSQSIAELEELLNSNKKGSAFAPYPDAIMEALNKENRTRGWLAGLEISRSAFAAIIDRVRTLVLDWALEMEKAGVKGTEFDFNMTEKSKAQDVTINVGTIGAFSGNLGVGNVAGNVTMRDLDLNRVGEVVRQLEPHVGGLVAAGADGPTLKARLDQLNEELQKPKPATSVLRGLLVDVRNAIAGAAGSLLATGATGLINQILGTGVPSGMGGV